MATLTLYILLCRHIELAHNFLHAHSLSFTVSAHSLLQMSILTFTVTTFCSTTLTLYLYCDNFFFFLVKQLFANIHHAHSLFFTVSACIVGTQIFPNSHHASGMCRHIWLAQYLLHMSTTLLASFPIPLLANKDCDFALQFLRPHKGNNPCSYLPLWSMVTLCKISCLILCST